MSVERLTRVEMILGASITMRVRQHLCELSGRVLHSRGETARCSAVFIGTILSGIPEQKLTETEIDSRQPPLKAITLDFHRRCSLGLRRGRRDCPLQKCLRRPLRSTAVADHSSRSTRVWTHARLS